ncbi:MAG: hypothetical protein R2875_13835 [Desulfobacterales bacterium]
MFVTKLKSPVPVLSGMYFKRVLLFDKQVMFFYDTRRWNAQGVEFHF